MTKKKKLNFFPFVYITICKQTDKLTDRMSLKTSGT